jgi:hypothetical protein
MGIAGARMIEVVLDGPPTPAWQAHALASLAESPVIDIVEVRLAGPRLPGVVRRLRSVAEHHLFHLDSDALAPTHVEPRTQSVSATLVVWLSERPAPTSELRDVLYLSHGQLVESAENAFGRAVLSGVTLVETDVLLRSAAGTVVVERTVSGVRPFSVTLSRDLLLWKLVALVRRAVERLPGLDLPTSTPELGAPLSTTALTARAISAWGRVLVTRLLFRRPWSIQVREHGPVPTKGWTKQDHLVRWRRSHVYADPFLLEHDGRHHLFCEEVPVGAKRGVISHTELRLDGAGADPPEPILQRPYHLSYPFVFAHEGEMFMIPETRAVRRVELYRAVDFPFAWQCEAVLLEDVLAVDATILFDDDRLWLFAGIASRHASSGDELHLFWAAEPQGPWHPHPRNPVVSDVRCARPAGAIKRWDSRLVRPTQDCSRRYGGAISFREIDVLSTTEYAEHEIDRLEPKDLGDARATHSYASDGRFEAIDLRRRELRGRSRAALLVGQKFA